MRYLVPFLLLACTVAAQAACTSDASDVAAAAPSAAGPSGSVDDADAGVRGNDAKAPDVPESDIGKSCSAGCGGVDLCTVASTTCSSGHCLFDGTSAYCTADCSQASCPSGFVCKDVPFELTRACVRDVGKQEVKGSITVSGAIGPNGGTPKPYTVTQTLDKIGIMGTFPDYACGSVSFEKGRAGAPGVFLILSGCSSDVSYTVQLDLPFEKGTFPNGPQSRFPRIYVSPDNVAGDNIAGYETKTPPTGMTLEVTELVTTSSANATQVQKLVATLDGKVPSRYCDPNTCGTSSDTVTVTANITLANISVPK